MKFARMCAHWMQKNAFWKKYFLHINKERAKKVFRYQTDACFVRDMTKSFVCGILVLLLLVIFCCLLYIDIVCCTNKKTSYKTWTKYMIIGNSSNEALMFNKIVWGYRRPYIQEESCAVLVHTREYWIKIKFLEFIIHSQHIYDT